MRVPARANSASVRPMFSKQARATARPRPAVEPEPEPDVPRREPPVAPVEGVPEPPEARPALERFVEGACREGTEEAADDGMLDPVLQPPPRATIDFSVSHSVSWPLIIASFTSAR